MDIQKLTSSETHLHSIDEPKGRRRSTAIVAPPHLDLEDLYCILQIQPNDSLIAMELARRLRGMNRVEEALRILRGILKIDYRFETLHALGQTEYLLEQMEEALVHLTSAVLIAPDASPDLFEIFKTLGNIFVRRGDFDSAEDNYNKAHRLNPDSDVLWVNLGTLQIQKGKWDESLPYFRKAIALKVTNDRAWTGLAIGHRMKGDRELAWGNIETALAYNPLNEVALGLALDWGAQEGREWRVLELLRMFLLGGGWNEKMSLAFAWLSWRRGDSRIARFETERLLAVNPANAQALALVQEMRMRR